ncbi:hypothetical protein C8Q80DRAFT_1267517 [Daedaleopsis nitida]|nr:hypothetical protein C8Q80DRAFT_1267517 [Daedaleopsis nitida]
MDVETLDQLPRAELQRLAKSMGLKANGKNADMIENLRKMAQSQQRYRVMPSSESKQTYAFARAYAEGTSYTCGNATQIKPDFFYNDNAPVWICVADRRHRGRQISETEACGWPQQPSRTADDQSASEYRHTRL